MEDMMVHVLYYVAQAAAAEAFMRYGAGGGLGRWGCSRSMNRVAPPGGDGGLHVVDSGTWVAKATWCVLPLTAVSMNEASVLSLTAVSIDGAN